MYLSLGNDRNVRNLDIQRAILKNLLTSAMTHFTPVCIHGSTLIQVQNACFFLASIAAKGKMKSCASSPTLLHASILPAHSTSMVWYANKLSASLALCVNSLSTSKVLCEQS